MGLVPANPRLLEASGVVAVENGDGGLPDIVNDERRNQASESGYINIRSILSWVHIRLLYTDTERRSTKRSRSLQVLAAIAAAQNVAFATDPDYFRRPLSQLNKEAAAFQKLGENVAAIATYAKLFRKAREMNIVHAEMYTCYSNRAAAFLEVLNEHADS